MAAPSGASVLDFGGGGGSDAASLYFGGAADHADATSVATLTSYHAGSADDGSMASAGGLSQLSLSWSATSAAAPRRPAASEDACYFYHESRVVCEVRGRGRNSSRARESVRGKAAAAEAAAAVRGLGRFRPAALRIVYEVDGL